MNELKEGYDYRFNVNSAVNGIVDIELTSGKYDGVVYRYGKVSVDEDEEKELAYLTFVFEVVDQKSHKDLETNTEFKDYIGEVLNSIMLKNMPSVEDDAYIEEIYED